MSRSSWKLCCSAALSERYMRPEAHGPSQVTVAELKSKSSVAFGASQGSQAIGAASACGGGAACSFKSRSSLLCAQALKTSFKSGC